MSYHLANEAVFIQNLTHTKQNQPHSNNSGQNLPTHMILTHMNYYTEWNKHNREQTSLLLRRANPSMVYTTSHILCTEQASYISHRIKTYLYYTEWNKFYTEHTSQTLHSMPYKLYTQHTSQTLQTTHLTNYTKPTNSTHNTPHKLYTQHTSHSTRTRLICAMQNLTNTIQCLTHTTHYLKWCNTEHTSNDTETTQNKPQ